MKYIKSLLLSLLLLFTLTGCPDFLSVLPVEPSSPPVTLETLPLFSGESYVVLMDNQPSFTKEELSSSLFESYSELDPLGRCGRAFALVGKETMPTEERGPIGMIKPSGWQTVRYNGIVDGNYLYNRCHLIGYQLTSENDNERNLITGTRYLNIEGMLPFENMVAAYVENTGNHVLYRVTPIFTDTNLLADGVVMEAYSVEDDGEGICFHIFAYNVQPGIVIDYATGESHLGGEAPSLSPAVPIVPPAEELPADPPVSEEEQSPPLESEENDGTDESEYTYILNKKSLKIHLPSCDGVQSMSEKNKVYFSGTKEEALAQGYSPCGSCKP